ncbi:MAG: helix-turn-helix domain-containing protein [Pseudomonas sp.]|uniref:helix-turn-helix domain-containing protein n=1 Tax=Pseudomonas sp. TaxID=306 RepID=UPI003D6F517F
MWTYWRDDFAEYGSWTSDDTPVSGMHFHDEQQLTFVISGCRLFRIGAARVRVPAGCCLYIPAGCPHASLPEVQARTRCLNLYVNDPTFGVQPKVLSFESTAATPATVIDFPFRANRHALVEDEKNIAQLAAEAGLSREAFTRKFTRQVGIPPHAHSVVARLNDARRLLRSGMSLADVAAACGFFDQTHLARHFLRVFGTTPGAYRKGMGRSQPYDG